VRNMERAIGTLLCLASRTLATDLRHRNALCGSRWGRGHILTGRSRCRSASHVLHRVGQDASTACCHRGRDECAAAGRMVRGSPTWVHPSIRFSETSIDTCLNSPTESCQIVSSTAVLKAAKTRISTPVCHLVVIAARVGRDSPALPACRASRCVRRRRAD